MNRILRSLILVICTTASVFAGTTGKIQGVLTNNATHESLPGATVAVQGTRLGAVAGPDGRFFIINVPPGTYTIVVSSVGFAPKRITRVEVATDLTTQLDVQLDPSSIELNETIITAQRPLFQRDNTAKLSIITADEFVNLPVRSVQDVLRTKAGFTTDADGNVHARGGRTGEIAYLVDGQFVRDPLYGDFNNALNKDVVQELSVVSGAFNAEYGQAMSSIVNIVTKDGGDDFHGKVEYTSPMLNRSPYRKANAFGGVQDLAPYTSRSVISGIPFRPLQLRLPVPGTVNISLSGPVPLVDGLTVFGAVKSANEDSWLPGGYDLQRDAFAKLGYRLTNSIKLSFTAHHTGQTLQLYDHAWKYLPDNQAHTERTTDRLALVMTHTLSDRLFYTVQLSRFTNTSLTQVADLQPDQYVRGQTGTSVYFYVSGDDARFADDRTQTTAGKVDLSYQYNSENLFKAGAELALHRVDVHEELEPWSGGAQFKDIHSHRPVEGSLYLQDKLEYDYLITNLGVRVDYVDPQATAWPDVRKFGSFDANNTFIPAPEEAVKPRVQVSPRIGLAHPITDRAVLHFSYGQFFQFPDFNALYYNDRRDLSTSLPLLGNASLKPQRTAAYEAGIKYRLADDIALEVSGWYKDISDLLSTLQVSYLSQDYVVYYNADYASVKGIDLTVNKRYSKYLSGSINYTFMVARGNNSQPLGGFVSAYSREEIPHREYYLDFDQTHTIVLSVNLSVPENEGVSVFGIRPFEGLDLNILVQAASGQPYTPYTDPSVRVEVNSARKPWTSTVDLRITKSVFRAGVGVNLFAEVTNLLDTQNVRTVYARTGKPFDTGVIGLVGSSPDADHNPAHLGPPRIIKAGVQVQW